MIAQRTLRKMLWAALASALLAPAARADEADGGVEDTAATRTSKAAREARDKASSAADKVQAVLKEGVDKVGEAGGSAAHDFDKAAHRAGKNLREEARTNRLLHKPDAGTE